MDNPIINQVLPKNTEVSIYFKFKDKIFEAMYLPDNRVMIRIVHIWWDGDIMDYEFEYADHIRRTGINPLHIVGIYDGCLDGQLLKIYESDMINNEIVKFLERYYRSEHEVLLLSRCAKK